MPKPSNLSERYGQLKDIPYTIGTKVDGCVAIESGTGCLNKFATILFHQSHERSMQERGIR